MVKGRKSSAQGKKKSVGKKGIQGKVKSKEIMESIFTAITDGILIVDKEYKITLVNRALAHEYGFDEPNDIIGKKCYNILREKKKKCSDCVATKVFKTGKTQHAYGSRKDAHGNEIYLEIYAYPVFDNKGKVVKVVEYSRNITREKILEKEVQETEKKLAEIFSVSRDMIAEVDPDMKVTFVNDNVKEFLGFSPREIMESESFLQFIAPESRKVILKNFKARISGKPVPELYEIWLLHKNGQKIPVEINVSLRKKDQKIIGIVATARDITERKTFEGTLKDSEKRYRTLFEKSPISITLLDISGKITDCNKATERLIGFSKKEIVGKHFDKLLTLDKKDLPKMRENYIKLSRGKIIKPYELEIIRKDNKKRWITVRSSPVKRDNEVVGFQVISTDITERKQAEEQIYMANERLHYLLSSTSAVIYSARTSGNYGATYISENVAQLVGYEPKEFLDNSNLWIDHVYPEDKERVLKEVSKLSKKEQHAYEYRFRHKKGNYIWMRDEMKLVRDNNGKPIEIIGYWLDITERKKALEELQDSEEKYSNLFQKSNDAIFLHDLQGNIIDMNQKVLDIFGYSKNEIQKLNISDLHPKEELKKSKKAFEKISKKGYVNFEIDFKKKSGEVFPAEVSSSLFEIGGKKVIQGIVRDISERRKAEEALRESEMKYRMLLEQSGDIITYFDTEGKLLAMNHNAARGLDGLPEDFIGKHLSDMFDEKVATNSLKRIRRVTQTQNDEEHEDMVNLPTRKGWYRSNYHPMKDTDNNVIGIQIISHDITERRQAEEEIKKLKEFNESIVQSMDEGILVMDKEGNMNFINPKMEKMLDYKRAKLVGEHWERIIAPDFHRRMRDCYAENLKGEHDRFEAVLLKKNKTELPVLISATPQFKDNMFFGVLAVITDISQRRREEIAREELMKYKMKRGSTYLIKEKELEKGKEVVYELYKNHFNGIIITREHPEIIKKDIDLKLPLYFMTNDPKDKSSIRPEFTLLEKIIDDHIDRNTFVFLDRFDYLVTQNSFNEALIFVQHLNEMFYARKAILIISLDPDTLNTQELSLLEKETSVLEKRHEERLSLDLIELLEFVNKRNLVGERPSYNDVGDEFRISRTTARKRIRELSERDLISERKSGRFKYLVLTEKGKDIL